MSDHDTDEFIRIQTALAGRYSLERELGRGGMGIVYLARDVALDRLVALKLLPPYLASDPSLRQRFLNEARTSAKLSHPNIIPIFAVEDLGALVFFVMAFVDGETLGNRVRTRGPVPASELARILRDVAWGLAYAHAQGVVHRDVKTDNILLERDSGRALVADFGIARVTHSSGVTGVGEILGTAEYMSPEQASGEAVDHRSDIYSLGVVAFYSLSGRLPFEGPTVAAVLAKHITQPAPPVASVVAGVPSKLARAVDRCLEKDPAARFATAEVLADAVAASLEARREMPVPIRIFIKNSRQASQLMGGVTALTFFFWTPALLLALDGGKGTGSAAFGFGLVGALILSLPLVSLWSNARTVIRAGYRAADILAAWKTELEQAREERAFEYGRTASRGERIFSWGARVAVGTALVADVVAYGFGVDPEVGAVFGVGTLLVLLAGVIALLRYERRTDLGGRLMGKFWNSRVGEWVFSLAGLRIKRSSVASPATHRPTELAIGMAVDSLFEALPKAARQHLADLPHVVRGLEANAMKMRQRVDELNDAVEQIESDTRRGPPRAAGAELAGRRDALDRDLHVARDAAKERMSDAVTALEGIRLNLLRLTAGAGSVDSLTADLAAARDVGEAVGRLLDGRDEVEAHLSSASLPTATASPLQPTRRTAHDPSRSA